jgi:hypothetical protein
MHKGLPPIAKVHPISTMILNFDLNNVLVKKNSTFNNFSLVGKNIIKQTWCTPIN